MGFSWPEYRRQQQQQQRQQTPEERLDDAADRLHDLCLALLSTAMELGISEAELVELLEVEREWFAGDVAYQINIFDQS